MLIELILLTLKPDFNRLFGGQELLEVFIMQNPRIKNEEQYKALIEKGYSQEKSARIANTPDAGKKGGKAKRYEEWNKNELYVQARKVGIPGRSSMSKKELMYALRNN